MSLEMYVKQFIAHLNNLGTGAKLDAVKEINDDIVWVFNNPIIKYYWSEQALITVIQNKMVMVCFGKSINSIIVCQSKSIDLPFTTLCDKLRDEITPEELAQLITATLL